MKYLFLLIMASCLWGDVVNNFELQTTIGKDNIKREDDSLNLGGYTEELKFNTTITKDNFLVSSKLVSFATNVDMMNENTLIQSKHSDLFFDELYLRYKDSDNIFGFGLLPFNNNSFSEYKGDASGRKGEGLRTLVDANLMNFFFMHNSDDISYKFGFGTNSWVGSIPNGDYIMPANKDSGIIWGVVDYKKGNFESYSQAIGLDAKYNNKHIADIGLLGSGFVYDDSDKSGFVIYDIVAMSYYRNYGKNVRSDILNSHNLPDYIDTYYPNSFGFDNNTLWGYSNLIGFRQDFTLKYDLFVDYEWFHTSNNWFSLNNGSVYQNDYNTAFNIRNNSHEVTVGCVFNDNNLLKLSYTHVEQKTVPKIGSPTETTSPQDVLGNSGLSSDFLFLTYILKF